MSSYLCTSLMYGVKLIDDEAKKLYDYSINDIAFFTLLEKCEEEIELLNDKTHYALHNMGYEKGFTSFFGLVLSTKTSEMTQVITNPPSNTKANFERYVLPVLLDNQINTKPEFHIITQTR